MRIGIYVVLGLLLLIGFGEIFVGIFPGFVDHESLSLFQKTWMGLLWAAVIFGGVFGLWYYHEHKDGN